MSMRSTDSRLRLFVFEPSALERARNGQLAFLVDVTWLECHKDEARFLGFLEKS